MTLDELLLEWSYRLDKGYPDMDNPSDILVLKNLLKELDLPTDDIFDKIEDKEGVPTYADKDGKPGTTGLEPSEYEPEAPKQIYTVALSPSELKKGNLGSIQAPGIRVKIPL